MDERKICFILCSNDEVLATECLRYVKNLVVPKGFSIETLVICDADSMTSGYNQAMKQSNAKYKVYLHQDVLLIEPDFIVKMIELFTKHPEIGMFGVVGNTSLAKDGCPWSDGMQRRIGELYGDLIYEKRYSVFAKIEKEYEKVIVLDGLLMATQYDLPWREDLFHGWDFYDCSQSIEFWKAGYQVVVPHMEQPWCLHDNDILHMEHYEKWRKVFEKEYKDFYLNWPTVVEKSRNHSDNQKKVIYQRFTGDGGLVPFPYPPIYQEKDTDYICFTDKKEISSKFWRVQCVDSLDEEAIRKELSAYSQIKEIRPDQIQIGSIFAGVEESNDSIVTIPSLHEIPEVDFDEKAIVPTKDASGNYEFKRNPVCQGGKYDGRNLLLTIGVPVSNQIETIDRCLSHIKPLLDELDSELLVIDTGSHDGTIDVCKSYGARIVSFPWCDNMSAARNMGIYHAQGAWYLSIDDDEWFEDVEDILRFFKSGTYKKCDAATYIQRNYVFATGEMHTDDICLRLARITPELHFEGRIHDAIILPEHFKVSQLSSYVHHYGFARDDERKLKEKYKRNASILLKDVYEYPTNLRYNFQLANEIKNVFQFNCETAIAYFFRGMSMAKELEESYLGKSHAANLLATVYNATTDRLFPMTELVLDSGYEFTPAEKAFFNYNLADMALRYRHSAEEILSYYNKYVKYRKEYEKNPLESQRLTFVGLHVCTNQSYIVDSHVIAFCAYCKQNDEKRALEELEQIVPEVIFDQRKSFFEHFLNTSDTIFEAAWEKITPIQGELWMTELMDAFWAGECGQSNFVKKIDRLSKILIRFSVRGISDYLQKEWQGVENTVKNFVYQGAMEANIMQLSVQELYFYASILQYELRAKEEDSEHLEIFLQYVQMMGKFVEQYFHSTLLVEKECRAIPGEMHAAYEISKALEAEQVTVDTVSHLRHALELFPGFKREIQMVLEVLGA